MLFSRRFEVGLYSDIIALLAENVKKEENTDNETSVKQIIKASQKLAQDERNLTKAKAAWEVERAKLKAEKSDLQMVMY